MSNVRSFEKGIQAQCGCFRDSRREVRLSGGQDDGGNMGRAGVPFAQVRAGRAPVGRQLGKVRLGPCVAVIHPSAANRPCLDGREAKERHGIPSVTAAARWARWKSRGEGEWLEEGDDERVPPVGGTGREKGEADVGELGHGARRGQARLSAGRSASHAAPVEPGEVEVSGPAA